VPLFLLKYLIRRAPDFFDWRSGVSEFKADPEITASESFRILAEANYEKYLTLTPQERHQKILEIQAWLEEDCQTLDLKVMLLLKQGNLLLADGDFENAIASYDQALHYKPDNDAAWYNRGIALAS
jgi:tetratricopeptide (TPR) repeat protein